MTEFDLARVQEQPSNGRRKVPSRVRRGGSTRSRRAPPTPRAEDCEILFARVCSGREPGEAERRRSSGPPRTTARG